MTLVVFSDKTPVEAFEDVCAQENQHPGKHDRVARWPQGKDMRLVPNRRRSGQLWWATAIIG